MTEQNMKKMYDWFIESGQLKRAKEISDIPRYAHFTKKKEESSGEKEIKEKKGVK